MWICLCVVILVLILVLVSFWCGNRLLRPSYHPDTPKILHLIYLPWDKQQRLKEDWNDFDHTYERNMRAQWEPKGWTVRMWTQPELRSEFPDVWNYAVKESVRPTQIVDLMRWVVLWKYGGLYLQYDSVPHVSLERFLPGQSSEVRLFTETVLTPEQSKQNAFIDPIRKGVPEEPVRVCNQVMSVIRPHHPFVELCCETILHNLRHTKATTDYQILWSSANTCISTLYDQVGQHNPTIELISEPVRKQWVTISSRGSWRTDMDSFVKPHVLSSSSSS